MSDDDSLICGGSYVEGREGEPQRWHCADCEAESPEECIRKPAMNTRVVPVEPTREMMLAGERASEVWTGDDTFVSPRHAAYIYKAMLAAAPQGTAAQQKGLPSNSDGQVGVIAPSLPSVDAAALTDEEIDRFERCLSDLGEATRKAAAIVCAQAKEANAMRERMAAALAWTDEDEPLPEDDAIRAAFPTVAKANYETYDEAMRLVGAKRSKGALVDLVNWLLVRLAAAEQDAERYRQIRCRGMPWFDADSGCWLIRIGQAVDYWVDALPPRPIDAARQYRRRR